MIDSPLDYVDKTIADKFIASLEEHIAYVREAGKKIGVPADLLAVHDNSKWSFEEFAGYAEHFQGGGAPDKFASAWIHHIHYNPHHWQHWIFPDKFTPKDGNVEDGVVAMPWGYAIEMVADWMGASRAYTGSWDMSDWLEQNIHKIKVHSSTAVFLRQVLEKEGYGVLVNSYVFDGMDIGE